VQYKSFVASGDSAEQRQEVLLDIRHGQRYDLVLENLFEVRIGAFVDQADGLVGSREAVDEFDDVLMLELPEEFDLPNGREIDPLLHTLGFDLFDGDDPLGSFLLCLIGRNLGR
jgi:hypothetical protein